MLIVRKQWSDFYDNNCDLVEVWSSENLKHILTNQYPLKNWNTTDFTLHQFYLFASFDDDSLLFSKS